MNNDRNQAKQSERVSPLYTENRQKKDKRAFIAARGRDLDGAYRVLNRLDAGESK